MDGRTLYVDNAHHGEGEIQTVGEGRMDERNSGESLKKSVKPHAPTFSYLRKNQNTLEYQHLIYLEFRGGNPRTNDPQNGWVRVWKNYLKSSKT